MACAFNMHSGRRRLLSLNLEFRANSRTTTPRGGRPFGKWFASSLASMGTSEFSRLQHRPAGTVFSEGDEVGKGVSVEAEASWEQFGGIGTPSSGYALGEGAIFNRPTSYSEVYSNHVDWGLAGPDEPWRSRAPFGPDGCVHMYDHKLVTLDRCR